MQTAAKIVGFLFVLSGMTPGIRAQEFVPDPGFNVNTGCPPPGGILEIPSGIASEWWVPQYHMGTSDYYCALLPGSWLSGDLPFAGFYAWMGNEPNPDLRNVREYLQTELTAPLEAGRLYRVSWKCRWKYENRLADFTVETDALGLYLSIAAPGVSPLGDAGPLPVTPQIRPLQTLRSIEWKAGSTTYVAAGGERFLTLGNFVDDASTVLEPLPDETIHRFYMYVDDVSIRRIDSVIVRGDTICPGETVTLTASNSDTYAWAEVSAPGTILSMQPSLTVSPAVTTAYYVYGSFDTAEVTVTVLDPPPVDLGPDRGLCQGGTLLLNAGLPGGSYRWQDQSVGATFTVHTPGTYWVEVTRNGCRASDSVQIHNLALPVVSIGNDTVLCAGAVLTLDASGPGLTYRWQDDSDWPTFTVSGSGTYAVRVTDTSGCQGSDTVHVLFVDPPQVDFSDTVLCAGDVWVVDITAAQATYLWQDKSVLPFFTIAHPGAYWARVKNTCGEASDSMEVDFRPCRCVLYAPDVFTPDGNGLNEKFRVLPEETCGLTEFRLTLFNRWGDVLFESSDPQFGWNGTLGGQPAPIDVYAYRVAYKFEKEPQKLVWGRVALLR